MERESPPAHNALAVWFCILAVGISAPAWAVGPQYVVTDLGTLGGSTSYAFDINDAGQVVGDAYTAGNATQHAFLYSNGTMTDLGTLGGAYSAAIGINNAGQVAGWADTAGTAAASHAFLYSNGTMTDLGTLGGSSSIAYGINDAGQVVGFAYTVGNATRHAFLFSNGMMTDLGTLGGSSSGAADINDTGQVVGFSRTTGNATQHAFLYSNGTMADIGTLGGSGSSANGINNAGQVVGGANTASNAANHAFLYSNGTMTDIGLLGGSQNYANGINDAGQVVGRFYTFGDGAWHAFLYSNGTMTNLDTLIDPTSGWSLTEANAINNRGQIVGYGSINGQTHAFLATPVTPQAVQETPQQLSITPPRQIAWGPSANNLVLITHGWRDDALPDNWPDELAQSISDRLTIQSLGSAAPWGWDIYTYDWSQDAGTLSGCFFVFTPRPDDCPGPTLVRAQAHGIKLARWLMRRVQEEGKQYEVVHLIAHSAGSGLIESLASEWKKLCAANNQPCPRIHSTFLDAFAPGEWQNYYGTNADWAEQYVDRSPDPGKLLFTTDRILPKAINFDVTEVNGAKYGYLQGPDAHGWPVTWYACSIAMGYSSAYSSACNAAYVAGDLAKFGFTTSLEAGTTNPLPTLPLSPTYTINAFGRDLTLCRGNEVRLATGAAFTMCLQAPSSTRRSSSSATISNTEGTEIYSEDSVTFKDISGTLLPTGSIADTMRIAGSTPAIIELTPHSPAWISSAIETAQPFNVLSFDYQFMSQGEDILSVFVDGNLVYRADQRDAESGMNHSGDVLLPSVIAPGLHTISFRVDPFGTDKAAVQITNLAMSENSTLAAKAGASQIVYPGRTVTLDGSASADSRGVALTYAWSQLQGGTTVTLSNAATSAASFVAPSAGTSGQVLTFQLDVTNPENGIATDTTSVQIVKLGDVTADGAINSIDLNLVLAGRGTAASGPNDLRDLDADGMITSLDARKLTSLCSKPRCAI